MQFTNFILILASHFALLQVFLCQEISCRSQTMPSIGGLCPNGYSLTTANECCLSTDCFTGPACADKLNSRGVNECPGMVAYCNNSLYRSLMQTQCPKTCNFCSSSSNPTTPSSTCADKVNPNTGKSECAQNQALCNNSVYKTFMQDQCPKTCKYC